MKLSNFQKTTIEDVLFEPYVGLFMSMSMGKTLSVLLTLEHLRHYGEWHPTIIVAPLLVAETVWPQEIEKWSIELSYTLIQGKPKARKKQLQADTDLHIVNFELLPWITAQPEFRKFRFLVVDEITRLAESSGIWHRAIYYWRKRFLRIIGLTGTPSAGGEERLYGIMRILVGTEIWKTKEQFHEMYFTDISKSSDYSVWVIKNESAKKRLYRDIAPHVITLHEKDYLDLPPYVVHDIWLELDDESREMYDSMEKSFFVSLDKKRVSAVNAGVKSQKLRQLVSGFIYDEDKVPHAFSNYKLWAAREMLSDMDENCIIAYQFIEERDQLLESSLKPKLISKKHKENITEWNKGKIHRAAGNPKSFGHGLNLQTGGFNILWYSLPWSLEQYHQLNSRLRRRQQEQPVTLIRLLFRDTIDEAVIETLDKRDANQEDLFDELKAYRDRRTGRGREKHPCKKLLSRRSSSGRTS